MILSNSKCFIEIQYVQDSNNFMGRNSVKKLKDYYSVYTALLLHPLLAYIANTVLDPLKW